MSIEIRNLTHVYNEDTTFGKKALDNINLSIEDGEFVGLIGHTGSGKSTLVQHLNALIKPTSGEIIIDNIKLGEDKKDLKTIRQKVGLVFQYPEHQLFEITVKKDVAFGPENLGLSAEEIEKRVLSSLKLVGIHKDDFEKSPFELSGGQKRRVAIAGILAMQPKVLVLDEPTAGLDPFGRDEILNKIKDMHKELKITVILVSHSMEDVARVAERAIVMHKGQKVYDASIREVFSHAEELEKIGLAAPEITYLMKELSKKGFDVPTDVYTTEEASKVLYSLLKQA